MLLHLQLGGCMTAAVVLFREAEDGKEGRRKDDAAHGGDGFGEEVDDGGRGQHAEDRHKANRQLELSDTNIWGYLPPSLALIFPAQDQHSEAIEGEAPDHTE